MSIDYIPSIGYGVIVPRELFLAKDEGHCLLRQWQS